MLYWISAGQEKVAVQPTAQLFGQRDLREMKNNQCLFEGPTSCAAAHEGVDVPNEHAISLSACRTKEFRGFVILSVLMRSCAASTTTSINR